MRVVLVCERLDGTDGWSRYSDMLRKGLQEQGHTVMTCTAGDGGGHRANLPRPLQLMTRPWLWMLVARRIREASAEFQPDIVHFTVEPYALAVPSLPKELRTISVMTIHGNYGIRPLRFWLSRSRMRKTLMQISRCVTVSTYTRDAVAEELRCTPALQKAFIEKAQIVHNGIHLPPFSGSTTRTYNHTILFVGAVKGSKGVREAILGCVAYRDAFGKAFRFKIAGTYDEKSPYIQEIRTLIREQGCDQCITLLGRVSHEELEKLYETSDVLLVPSLTAEDTFEGFGLVYIEANAHGVPAIGPNRSGSTEAIADGKSGYTVDPTSPQAIADALHSILDERRISSQDCRAWAEEHNVDTMIDAVIGVYKNLTITAS